VLFRSGKLHLATKNTKKGEASYLASIAAQPTSVSGYRALSGLYLAQRKFVKASELLQRGLAKIPGRENFVLRLLLATVFEQTGKKEKALAEYETLITQQPGSTVVANNLASLYSDMRSDEKSLDRALALARQFRNSKIPQFKDTLGWLYYKRGEYRKAIPLLQDAALDLSRLPMVRYHLGMSYLKNKQNKKAAVELEKTLELIKGIEFPHKEQLLKALEESKAPAAN